MLTVVFKHIKCVCDDIVGTSYKERSGDSYVCDDIVGTIYVCGIGR